MRKKAKVKKGTARSMRIKFATKVRFKNFFQPIEIELHSQSPWLKESGENSFSNLRTIHCSKLLFVARIKENMKRRHDASTVSIKFQFCELIIFYKKWKLSILPHYSIRKTNTRINFRSPWHDSFIHIYGLIPIYLASQYIYIHFYDYLFIVCWRNKQ